MESKSKNIGKRTQIRRQTGIKKAAAVPDFTFEVFLQQLLLKIRGYSGNSTIRRQFGLSIGSSRPFMTIVPVS